MDQGECKYLDSMWMLHTELVLNYPTFTIYGERIANLMYALLAAAHNVHHHVQTE